MNRLTILPFRFSGLRIKYWIWNLLVLAACSSSTFPAPIGAEEAPRLIIDSRGPSGTVKELLFTPDGDTLISLGEDKTICFWDVATGDLRKTLRLQIGDGSIGKLTAGAISPDGRWLAVGGSPSLWGIRLIDLETYQIGAVLWGHSNVISDLAFSDDGRILASGSLDDSVRVWDVGGEEEKMRRGGGRAIILSESQELTGHTANVNAVDFAPGAERLVSGAYDSKLILWERGGAGRYQRKATLEKHTAGVWSAAFSPDGRRIVSGGNDQQLLLWDGLDGGFLRSLADDMENFVGTVTFSPDGGRVIASSQTASAGYTAIYDLASGERVTTFREHTNTVAASAWHPTGNLVASAGGNDKDIYLWRPDSGEVVHHLRGVGRPGWAVAFAEGGLKVAFGQGVREAKDAGKWNDLEAFFNFTTFTFEEFPAEQSDPPGFRRTVRERAGKELKETDIYHLQTGSGEIAHDPALYDQIRCYSFTPTGDVVVGSEFSLKLHSPTGELVRNFIGHEGITWAISPSPDGRYLASASNDQTVRLWNLQTGELLASLFITRDDEWVV